MWEVRKNPPGVAGMRDGRHLFIQVQNDSDAEWLCEILESATDTVIKLFCQTATCKDKGGFITRAATEAKRVVNSCDTCGQPMTRKVGSSKVVEVQTRDLRNVPELEIDFATKVTDRTVANGTIAPFATESLGTTIPERVGRPTWSSDLDLLRDTLNVRIEGIANDIDELDDRLSSIEQKHSDLDTLVQTFTSLRSQLATMASALGARISDLDKRTSTSIGQLQTSVGTAIDEMEKLHRRIGELDK